MVNSKNRFVFRLGPLDKDDGQFFMYYVYPGKDDAWAFPAASDTQAFELILDVYKPAELCCEPALSSSAAAYGIDPAPFDDLRSHELSLMTYEHLADRPLREVKQEGLIYHFLNAVHAFTREKPWLNAASQPSIAIEFSGSLSFPTRCYVRAGAEYPLFTLLLEPEEPGTPPAGSSISHALRSGHIGIELHHAPAFAVDALQRAYGMDGVPVPFVFRDGHREAVSDMQMALLITAMTAVRFHGDSIEGAEGAFEHGDIRLAANTRKLPTA